MKKTTKFEWTDKCEKTFQELRKHLIIAWILTLLVEGKEHIIYSDAPKNVLGCIPNAGR